ncbi:MAG TPA: DUF4097 family beta strand repeat protein [Candidatus Choladousia intestinipullorum]|nr:DUF4097 family beta strand repeat protein [Candidatus Choladousia intestinipullorum]
MKRSTKRLLLLALIFAIAGSAFGIVSVCAGFELSEFQKACENGDFQLIGPDRWTEDMKKAVSGIRSGSTEKNWSYQDVDSLVLDIGAADCTLIPGDTDEWKVIGHDLPAQFRCEQKNHTLEVSCKKGFWEFLNIFSLGVHNAKIEIWIPASVTADEIQIDTGAGDLSMPEGMIRCREMEINCGVGDIQICADITKKLEIDGGVGDAGIELYGKEQDFDYDVDSGVGEVRIGGSHYSDLGSDIKLDHDAEKEIKIDNGVGDVTISFTENVPAQQKEEEE